MGGLNNVVRLVNPESGKDLGKTPEGKHHLSRFYLIESFAPATSADYDPVREAFARVGLKVK